jgi:hypothetical protein
VIGKWISKKESIKKPVILYDRMTAQDLILLKFLRKDLEPTTSFTGGGDMALPQVEMLVNQNLAHQWRGDDVGNFEHPAS